MLGYLYFSTISAILKGGDESFLVGVRAGDPVYTSHWERIQQNPEDLIFGSVAEGMEKIAGGRLTFLILEEDRFTAVYVEYTKIQSYHSVVLSYVSISSLNRSIWGVGLCR